MKLQKISSPSLKDLFVKELESIILSGEVEIGEAFPSERDMAEQMGVSRAVITAGLSELASKGFVEIRPRSGCVVADYRRKGTIETLVSIMNYNGGTLRHNEVRSIIEIRLALEKIMLKNLIPNITDRDISDLEKYLTKIKDSESPSEAIDNAFTFHHELMVLCGNTLLPLIYYSFRVPIFTLWEKYISLYGRNALYDNAAGLLEYIKRRDIDGAMKWSERYLSASISGDRQIY